jgi:hypothetical protein
MVNQFMMTTITYEYFVMVNQFMSFLYH